MTKEINEFLDGVELVGVHGKKIAKDGISLSDVPEALEVVKNVDVIIAAVTGIKAVPAEFENASDEDLIAIGLRVLKVVKAIKAA